MSYGINFEKEMKQILADFGDQVTQSAKEAVSEVAKESVKKLRKTSPRRKKNGGAYAKGWTYKVEEGRVINSATVYGNKKTYPLAHLLEHGHARRGGGRKVEGIPHIAPVEEWAKEELVNRIREKVEG